MENAELYRMLEIPNEVEKQLIDYGRNREIAIHIPSDADLGESSVAQSINDFNDFRAKYYPEWKAVNLKSILKFLCWKVIDFSSIYFQSYPNSAKPYPLLLHL